MKSLSGFVSLVLFLAFGAFAEEQLPTPAPEVLPKPQDFSLPQVQSGGTTVPTPPKPHVPGSETIPAGTVSPAPATSGTVTQSSIDTFSQTTAENFSAIFNDMLQRGFVNGRGHTVAASLLASCLPELNAGQRVEEMMTAIYALSTSRHPVIQTRFQRGIGEDSAVTQLAAILVCKKGTRTAGQMVSRLELAYSRLFNDGLIRLDSFHNVVVAANLLD